MAFIHRLMGASLLGLFLLVLLAAFAPSLHKAVHDDADHEEHSCAVTLILSGGAEAPSLSDGTALFLPAPLLIVEKAEETGASSAFLSGYIPEHAPPRFSCL
ncbi:MAG: hypothetical protein PHV34_10350 [Verrucomicrobiae bacterium]|nr:hypothetical protein [Verrucomicrobiae bacterium]